VEWMTDGSMLTGIFMLCVGCHLLSEGLPF
jgi:hypothetical protein